MRAQMMNELKRLGIVLDLEKKVGLVGDSTADVTCVDPA